MTLHIGFTGSRSGMSVRQRLRLRDFFAAQSDPVVFHHGDCIGADAEAHEIAREYDNVRIVVHPPSDSRLRAWCAGDEIRKPLPYIARNHVLVDECSYLLAAPERPEEYARRSGTWATWRYAEGRATRMLLKR